MRAQGFERKHRSDGEWYQGVGMRQAEGSFD
jgi:hypothetical protein